MHTETLKTIWKTVLVAICMVTLTAAAAKDAPENFQVVDGVEIYLGVMPAQIVLGHFKGRPESKMHGGVPTGSYREHVVVALFDDASGQRIENAQVTAAVMELGLGTDWKTLEPMRIASTITYGSYFAMPGNDIYHVKVQIRWPGHPQPVEATFTHRHFAP